MESYRQIKLIPADALRVRREQRSLRGALAAAMAAVGVTVSVAAGAQGPQYAQGQQQQAPPPSVIQHVRGVVVNSIDLKPVARVLVTSGDQRMAQMTDDEGRFSFDVRHPAPTASSTYPGGFFNSGMRPNLGSNQMMVYLMARRPGYTNQNVQVPIALTADASTGPDLVVKLVPESALRGHVSVPGGDLPAGLFVQLRRKMVQEGVGVWVQVQGAQVNARGDFRMAELQAGDYKVMVQASTVEHLNFDFSNSSPAISRSPGFLPAFSGDATDLATATVIHLSPGQTADVTLNLKAATFYHVSIPIKDYPPGQGLAASIGEQDGSSGFQLMVNPQSQRVDALLPNGSYDVQLSGMAWPPGGVRNGPALVVLGSGPPAPRQQPTQLTGFGRIDVAGAPVNLPPIALQPAGTLPVVVHEQHTATDSDDSSSGVIGFSGGIAMDGRRQIRSTRPLELSLRSLHSIGRGANLRNPTAETPDPPLELENVTPGTYEVIANAHKRYIAAISSNGIDLLREPLVVGPGGAASPIEVTIRDDGAKLSGTVAGAGDPASLDGLPLLFECIPLDEPMGRAIQGGGMGQGRFSFQNIPPGRYVVIALRNQNQFQNQFQNIEYRNPEVLRDLESKGTVVTLSAGQKAEIQVPLLPGGEN